MELLEIHVGPRVARPRCDVRERRLETALAPEREELAVQGGPACDAGGCDGPAALD